MGSRKKKIIYEFPHDLFMKKESTFLKDFLQEYYIDISKHQNLIKINLEKKEGEIEENKFKHLKKIIKEYYQSCYFNRYRYKKINTKYLLITEQGHFTFLSEDEFKIVQDNQYLKDMSLCNKLFSAKILINPYNEKRIAGLLSYKLKFLQRGPGLHIIIPTMRCNAKCIYCHASSKDVEDKDQDMTIETLQKTVNFIFKSTSQYITIEFQGGEPLLRFDLIKELVLRAKKKNQEYKKNLKFTIVSNLYYLTEEILIFLIENDISICTSLDGPEELHNKNRPIPGCENPHKMLCDKISLIRDYFEKYHIDQRNLSALPTITSHSLTFSKEIIEEYRRLGFSNISLRFLNKLGVAQTTWEKIQYSAKEFSDFWEKSLAYIHQTNEENNTLKERSLDIFLKKIFSIHDPNYMELRSPCGMAIGQIVYTPKGDIYTCDEARSLKDDTFKLGSVLTDTYEEILFSPKCRKLVDTGLNDNYGCNYCVYKPYCGVCPVCNYGEFNSIFIDIHKTSRCKIMKAQFDFIFKNIEEGKISYLIRNTSKKN